jgi:hypothetical protein
MTAKPDLPDWSGLIAETSGDGTYMGPPGSLEHGQWRLADPGRHARTISFPDAFLAIFGRLRRLACDRGLASAILNDRIPCLPIWE